MSKSSAHSVTIICAAQECIICQKKKKKHSRKEGTGRAKTFVSPLPSLCQTVWRVSGAGASAQEKTRITSRSHAAAAWHGVQLIPLQERSGAHRNDRHMVDLSAGAPHTNTTLRYTHTHTRTQFLTSEVRPLQFRLNTRDFTHRVL